MENQKNNILIAIVSVLATIAVVLVVACVLLFTNQSSKNVMTDPQQPQAEQAEQAPEQSAQQENVQPTTMYVANVKNSIYLRSMPEEVDSNIITTIPVGTQIMWLKDENPVFSKISYGGQTGYVKRDYLSTVDPKQNSSNYYTAYTNNTRISKYQYVANVKNSIYLRSTMYETSDNIITTIPLGTQVGFIEYANNDFSKINYNGTIGYAKTMYLEDYYTRYLPSVYMTVCNVKNSIYLRNSPDENDNNNIICTIPLGSTVEFISDTVGGFYQIKWDGYTGYAKSQYLR